MVWTMPQYERPDRPGTVGERESLEWGLEHQRRTLLWKCAGLTGEQLATRSVGRSSLSLLGIIRHLAGAERWWFRRWFAGEDVPLLYDTDDDPDLDFHGAEATGAERDLVVYLDEVERCRAVVAGRSLDDTFHRPHGETTNLRWLFVHMITEYARHNGHADLLREHIDGSTGY